MRKTVQIQSRIKKEFPDLNISEEKISLIDQYLNMLSHWNSKINLTAIRDINQMITKHILDSLAVYKTPFNKYPDSLFKGKILDVGSGAGIPGIILSICDPTLEISSIDKAKKKIMFQDHVKSHLGLKKFLPIDDRLENLSKKSDHVQSYDFIISRAFDQIKGLLNFGDIFLKSGGHLVLWKGKKWREEMEDVPSNTLKKFCLKSTTDYLFQEENHGGTIVIFQKIDAV
ncbi:16S rRNA (guanine(527)-N(7))-methyltransferase RsmG [bacterium]|nr:16S rRNA (guanine(527)-N(7))-methyltransferase RsmG [bacterium]